MLRSKNEGKLLFPLLLNRCIRVYLSGLKDKLFVLNMNKNKHKHTFLEITEYFWLCSLRP